MFTESDIIRFYNKIQIDPITRCWNWTASLTNDGYGQFGINGTSGRRAHRISYQYFYDVDPGRFDVCHECDNPKCVNPNHLWLGTMQDNVTDMINKGRAYNAALTSNDVRQILIDIWNDVYRDVDQICLTYNITRASIYQILNGKSWKSITSQLQVPLFDIKDKVVKRTRGSKLSEDNVKRIKQYLTSGHYTQLQIGEKFDISESTIHDIKHKRSWAHIV